MKSLFTTLLFISLIVIGQAQPGGREMPKIGKLSGTVYDSISQKPLEFATVSVFRMRDSALVGGMITDEKGKFEIDQLPIGRHRVTISYMGYSTYTVPMLKIFPNQPTVDLEKIYVAPTEATLKTAEVTADKAVFQLGLDKRVFNVDKTNLGDSENATEILRNTPTVEVDFDGAVKIRGAAVQVYINGKPTGLTGDSQAEILDQLPANTVKKVELITSPSAKYDPEGASGIINIVLKKNVLEGFTGSANVSIGTSTWVPFGKYRGGLSLNFRNNKINIFSNFSYNYRESYSRNYNYRATTLPTDTSFLEQFTDRKRIRNGAMARIGMDYYFDDYNTLTIAARLRPSGGGNSSNIQYDYLDANQLKMSISERINDGSRNRFSMTYNLVYAKVFKQKKKDKNNQEEVTRRDNSKDSYGKGRRRWHGGGDGRAGGRSGTMGDKQELVIDLQYSMNNNSEFETFSEQLYLPDWTEANSTPDSQYTTNYNKMHQGTMRIDYTHPFNKKMKLEVGYKGNIRWLGNDFSSESFDYNQMQMLNDTGRTNNFQYQEQVHAVYATFAQQIGKFRYKLGLRGEYTLADSRLVYPTDSTFRNNYPSIFPSVHLSYELPKNQQVQLGFSRRIQRPSTWALNPFPSYSDPLNLRYGNPYLLPQYTNAVELSYVNYWKGGNTIMLTAFYKYNTDQIVRLRTLRQDGVSVLTHYNFSTSHMWGGELVTRFVPFKWWNFGLTGSVYQNIQDGTNVNEDYSVNAIAGNVNVNMNFVFKFGMRISLYAWYSIPTKVAQGWTGGYTWNSFSVSQKVLKNKGTVTLSVRNPILGGQYQFETSDGRSFSQSGKHQWESPVFELRFSYRFGKVNVRDGRSKNASRLRSGSSNGDGGEGGEIN
ncbi:outer membrane beta-barrel family protein [Aureispira anguillae]|uniref:TonB dependent receptor n=1 Tax=Aureispira anguillae TaxID=2864201 RepID=A0A915YI61_9BACT|nr:outer membrane beta-barrel family protein [Aureispira anguillae]BDS13640.1 TonB dependent receptor [Aureispira anguillae]